MRRALVSMGLVVVLLIGFAAVILLVVRPFSHDLPIPVGRPCLVRTDTGEVALEADQMANAATIAAVGLSRQLPDKAVVVALATAMQESELINVPYGDRDSLGRYYNFPTREGLEQFYASAGPWSELAIETGTGGGYDGVPRTTFNVMATR